ncbi:MAG: hypothetical protein AB7N65_28145 [Vicinamibacterales bacterium]
MGLLLIAIPWSTLWERNYFIERYPAIHAVCSNVFLRGAVSGVGLVNLFAGFAELLPIFTVRARHDVAFGDEADTQARP